MIPRSRVRQEKALRSSVVRSKAQQQKQKIQAVVKENEAQIRLVSPVGVSISPAVQTQQNQVRERTHQKVQHAQEALKEKAHDSHFRHELAEMQEQEDLEKVDDVVEDIATLLQWKTAEHPDIPKSIRWYMGLAAAITVCAVTFILLGNIMAAITVALSGGLMYYIAQQKPADVRYRIMTEGVALNNTLYHYRDLESFNIVYEPGEVKTVVLRSKRRFAPLMHMEIGDTDPVEIRELLLQFVREDQDLQEPIVVIWARRLGF